MLPHYSYHGWGTLGRPEASEAQERAPWWMLASLPISVPDLDSSSTNSKLDSLVLTEKTFVNRAKLPQVSYSAVQEAAERHRMSLHLGWALPAHLRTLSLVVFWWVLVPNVFLGDISKISGSRE